MGFGYLDHTADLAVRAWAGTPGGVFAQAALALSGAMVNVDRVRALRSRRFSLHASSLDLLLVEWLSALVAEKDTSGLVFSRFDVEIAGGGDPSLRAEAWGEPLDPVRHEARTEVKGISLLGLRVRAEGEGWSAEYVADI